jgi:O-antigen/teichoic acid export membrane protein
LRNNESRNLVYYMFIPFVRAFLSFAILPILTRYVAPDAYGIVALATIVVTAAFSIFSLSVEEASYRFFFDHRERPERLHAMLSSNLIFDAVAIVVTLAACVLIFPAINGPVFNFAFSLQALILLAFQFGLSRVNSSNQLILKAQGRGLYWLVSELISIVVNYVSLILLAVVFKAGFMALVASSFLAEAVKTLILLPLVHSFFIPKVEGRLLGASLRYSMPISLSSLISIGVTSINRFFLNASAGLADVGILEMGNKIALAPKIIMDGIGGVFSPYSLSALARDGGGGEASIRRVFTKITAIVLCPITALASISPLITQLLLSKSFDRVGIWLPALLFIQALGLWGMITSLMVMQQKKTWIIPLANGLSSIATLLVNILFSKRFGIGAAILASAASAIISMALSLGATLKESRKCIDFAAVLGLWVINILVLAVSMTLNVVLPDGLWHSLSQVISFLVILAIPFLLRTVSPSEALRFAGRIFRHG